MAVQEYGKSIEGAGYKRPIYNFHEGQNNTDTKNYIKQRFIGMVDAS